MNYDEMINLILKLIQFDLSGATLLGHSSTYSGDDLSHMNDDPRKKESVGER